MIHFETKGLWEDGKTQYNFGKKVKETNNKQKENKKFPTSQPIEDLSKILHINRQAPKMWEVNHPEKGADKGGGYMKFYPISKQKMILMMR